MTKNFCKQCGSALTKTEAKFCTICGATVDAAAINDISNQETVALPGEQGNQASIATEVIPAITPKSQADFSTEVIPAVTPISYATEEMQKPVITARTEERATEVIEVIAPIPATRPLQLPAEPAPAQQPSFKQPKEKSEKKSGKKSKEKSGKKSEEKSAGKSGRRKKWALAAAVGVVVVMVAATAIFFVNSRRATEVQAETQLAGAADQSASATSATSAQPVTAQPDPQANPQLDQASGAGADNQAQSQARPQPGPSIGNVKSPADHNDGAASKPQQQAATNSTPATPKLTAEDHKKLGIDHMNSGRYQEALQEYEYVRKLDPGNKDVYYLLGSTYQRMNQLPQALEAYRQCTSGTYAGISQNAVKNLEKRLKISAK